MNQMGNILRAESTKEPAEFTGMQTQEGEGCQLIQRGGWGKRYSINSVIMQSSSLLGRGEAYNIYEQGPVPFFFLLFNIAIFLPIEARTRGQHPICLG